MQIELSWPAKALSPNYRSRSHWPRTRALKVARSEGFGAALAAAGCGGLPNDGERIPFVITAYPPTAHARDDDNLIASLKAARDGIANALLVDDRLFETRLQWGEPVKGGRVVVTIGEAA